MPHLKYSFSRRVALIAAAVVAATTMVATSATAAVPTSMVVDGFLHSTGGGAAADGVYDVTFAIYNVQSGGTAAWKEGPLKVSVKGGQFTHALGASKAISAATLDKLTKAWLELKVGADPALPRQALRSVAYAVLADTAKSLACSGCVKSAAIAAGTIGADKVGFTFAGAKTKGGPANLALDVQCTGCVSVSELKIDKDLDLGGNALKAKAVVASSISATTFQGDGSKLTGIKTPAGECKVAGEVVKGINPDGSLKCVKAMDPKALPADGIDEISNFLIHNQFQNSDCIPKPVPIKDNNPIGVSAELTFGDYGLSQKLDVLIDLKNSDLTSVTVKLWDPANTEYLLWDKTAKGNSLSGVWPSKTKVLKGDLTKWVGKNPKGKWRIQVIDQKFLNNGNDGAVNKFCVNIQTLSNKKIGIAGDLAVAGDLVVDGNTTLNKDVTVEGNLKVKGTLDATAAARVLFPPGSRPFVWGWYGDRLNTSSNYGARFDYPYQAPTSTVQQVLTYTRHIVYGDKGGNIMFQRGGINYANNSSDKSQGLLVAFIKNTTGAAIKYSVCMWYSSRGSSGAHGGIAVNSNNVWYHGGNARGQTCQTVSFPANKTSTLVNKSGCYYYTNWNGQYNRNLNGYYNNTWLPSKMPKGLEWDYDMYYKWMQGG